MKTAEQIGSFFEGEAWEKFLDVSMQRVLGASRHIRLIGDMFCYLGQQELPTEEMEQKIRDTGEFFIETRGKSSCAITNAVKMMFGCFFNEKEPIQKAVDTYFDQYKKDVEKVIVNTLRVIGGMEAAMLYDYSSTVDKAFARAAKDGKQMDLYIPESNILDGGMPYIHNLSGSGHRLHFIPDSAILYFLKKCDGAFIGAETCFPDGTSFNTTGSEMVALLCRQTGKSFYVLTPLLKIDTRAFDPAFQKPPVMDDLSEKLMGGATEIDCICPEITAVLPEDITGIVTEEGIFSPAELYAAAKQYAERMEDL